METGTGPINPQKSLRIGQSRPRARHGDILEMRLPHNIILLVKTPSGTLWIARDNFHRRYLADPWSLVDALYKAQTDLQSRISDGEKRVAARIRNKLGEAPSDDDIRQTAASGSQNASKPEADAMLPLAPRTEPPSAPEPPLFGNMGYPEFGNWANLLRCKLEAEGHRFNTPERRLSYLVEHMSGPA